MKRCPKCKDNKVITFDSDNDWCGECKEWFPAVAEEEDACETGCKHFHGGEIKHRKDCYFYPESFSKMYDDEKQKNEDMKHDIKRIIVEIQSEILKNIGKPNFGKNSCLTRLNQLLDGKFKGTAEEIYSEEPIEEVIVTKSLVKNLANDIWAIAKKIKRFAKIGEDLKTISLCLHDIEGDRKTGWYQDARKEFKKQFSSKRVL